jgi:hypothetical protein
MHTLYVLIVATNDAASSIAVYPWHCLVPFLAAPTTTNEKVNVKPEVPNATPCDNEGR